MIDNDYGVEVVCCFCGYKYYFSEEEFKYLVVIK